MGVESQPSHEVFISYSSKDKKWADAACAMLEKHRIRCWIAPRDITPGTEWGAGIIQGLDASKIMVLIFSANANDSAQVRREVERAISKGLAVLPFRVENVAPAGAMEYALGNTHWLDGFTKPVERQFELLAKSVGSLLTRDVTAAVKDAPAGIDQPDDGRPKPAPRLLIAAGEAVLSLTVVAVAGLAIFRGDSGKAAATREQGSDGNDQGGKAASRSDEDRIQGRWDVLVQDTPKKKAAAADLDVSKPVWTFRGSRMTIRSLVDGAEKIHARGTFTLHPSTPKDAFDFAGVQVSGDQTEHPVEYRGIYEFEGEYLKIAYRMRRMPDEPAPSRPTELASIRGRGGVAYVKFKRAGN